MNKPAAAWNFLSNHAYVLVCLADNPRARLRDVANQVDITERTVLRLVTELEAADVLERVKAGRRNRYIINRHARLQHPLDSHWTVGDLLTAVASKLPSPTGAAPAAGIGE
jgi:DNA-binding Lrp family transcriptional regulator